MSELGNSAWEIVSLPAFKGQKMTTVETCLRLGADERALDYMRQSPIPQEVLDRLDEFHQNWLQHLASRPHDAAAHLDILSVLAEQGSAPSISKLLSYLEMERNNARSKRDRIQRARYLFTLLIMVHTKKINQPVDDLSVFDRLLPYFELRTTRLTLIARHLAHSTPSCSELSTSRRL